MRRLLPGSPARWAQGQPHSRAGSTPLAARALPSGAATHQAFSPGWDDSLYSQPLTRAPWFISGKGSDWSSLSSVTTPWTSSHGWSNSSRSRWAWAYRRGLASARWTGQEGDLWVSSQGLGAPPERSKPTPRLSGRKREGTDGELDSHACAQLWEGVLVEVPGTAAPGGLGRKAGR